MDMVIPMESDGQFPSLQLPSLKGCEITPSCVCLAIAGSKSPDRKICLWFTKKTTKTDPQIVNRPEFSTNTMKKAWFTRQTSALQLVKNPPKPWFSAKNISSTSENPNFPHQKTHVCPTSTAPRWPGSAPTPPESPRCAAARRPAAAAAARPGRRGCWSAARRAPVTRSWDINKIQWQSMD